MKNTFGRSQKNELLLLKYLKNKNMNNMHLNLFGAYFVFINLRKTFNWRPENFA